jgi:predicted HTH domain antitoxin
MAITLQIPPDIEEHLRSRLVDLDQAAKEAMAVELYRQGKLTHYELSRLLDLSRYETDGVLKRHNVTEDLPTVEELRRELADSSLREQE